MTKKPLKPAEYGIVKYFQSVQPEFKKYGLELVATLTEFVVHDERSGNAVFWCDTVAGIDGFLRGLAYAAEKNA